MSQSNLKISAELALPMDAITQRLGWLGTSGSGKTYGAGKLAEEMLAAGAQVIVLDPVGPWWGLRSSADGKRAGFAIIVFGGIHADLPLTPDSGALVADILVDRGVSAVLDVSDMTLGQMTKFVSAFAERFFDRKKRNPTPVHLFLEEAHTFVPQQLPPEPAAAIMFHRMERVVRVGRNYGIGSSQISQMPQAVAKKTLNQVQCLFTFGIDGSQERKALASWFDQNGGREVAAELPALPTGTAFAISTRWLKLTQKLVISKKQTFDSSKTPTFGGPPPAPKVLAPVDVEQLKAAMAETIAAATADDPKALRKRIAELERELKAKPAAPAPKVETVEKPVITEAHVKRLERELSMVETVANSLAAQVAGLREIAQPIAAGVAAFKAPVPVAPFRHVRTVHLDGGGPPAKTPNVRPDVPELGERGLGRGERAVLTAIAQHGEVSREQLTIFTGYKRSTRDLYLQHLTSAGFVERRGDHLVASQAGLDAIGPGFEPLPTGDGLLRYWLGRLPQGERVVLEAVVAAYPSDIDREILSERCGYKRSTRDLYLQHLATRKLIETSSAGVRASKELFS